MYETYRNGGGTPTSGDLTGDSTIETTIHHPFWVVRGYELFARSTPRKFSDDQDQGQALDGRWVNSHEIQAGDVIIGRDGKPHIVTGVSQRFERAFSVSNLTIEELHNYSVGVHSILVHNDAICDAGIPAMRTCFGPERRLLMILRKWCGV